MRIKAQVHGRRKYARRKVRRHNIVNNCKSVYIHGKVYDFSKLQRFSNNIASVLTIWLEKQCPAKRYPNPKGPQKEIRRLKKAESRQGTTTNVTRDSSSPNSPSGTAGPVVDPSPRRPSKRGEHVINQGVLKIEKDILKKFSADNFNLGNVQTSVKLPSIESDVQNSIEDMRVTFDDHEQYTDDNSVPYGRASEKLVKATVKSMNDYWKYKQSERQYLQSKEVVDKHVNNMIGKELFVDEKAKDKWLEDHDSETFNKAKENVKQMFRGLADGSWVAKMHDDLNKSPTIANTSIFTNSGASEDL